MRIFQISDLHFSSKLSEEHRFDLFRQVREIVSKNNVDTLLVLGDITEAKDNHSSTLVNKVVSGFASIGVDHTIFLSGNHDGITAEFPYFEFLNHIESCTYITTPTEFKSANLMLLPHTRDPLKEWKDLDFTDKIVFAHVSVNNAIAENSQKLTSSVHAEVFDKAKRAFSGDIHLQQKVGPLEYVGSPYDTRYFAANVDHPLGRGVLLDTVKDTCESFFFVFPRLLVFDYTDEHDLTDIILHAQSKDINYAKIKLRLHLTQNNMSQWRQLKEAGYALVSEHKGFEVTGFEMVKTEINPTKTTVRNFKFIDFDGYCSTHKIQDHLKQVGKEIIAETV